MSSGFVATDAELALVSQIFIRAGSQRSGVLTGDAAVEIFGKQVGLPPHVLSTIWNFADEEHTGNLSRRGVAIAVRLIGWAQRGAGVTPDLVNIPGPVPSIEGISNVHIQSGDRSPSLPPFTQVDGNKFLNSFLAWGPVNGLLTGDRARDCFLKSSLSAQDLWQIWNLADTHKRGALDIYDYSVGMYLIQASESGRLPSIPVDVPAGIREQITGAISMLIAPASPSTPPKTPVIKSSVVPQSLGSFALSSPPPAAGIGRAWDVTPEEKFDADEQFDTLDPQNSGVVEGNVVAKYMLRFRLQPEDLAQIWDLADINNDDRLTRDGFAVAIHLIHRKLSGGDLPHVLPSSLMPPSMKSNPPVPTRSFQDVQHKSLSVKVPLLSSVDDGQKLLPLPPPRPPRPLADSVSPTNYYPSTSIQPEDVPPALPPKPDQYQEEDSALESGTEALLAQFESQNDDLARENNALLAKIQEAEQITSELLNERNSAATNFTQQNRRLSRRIADMEQVQSQLAQSKAHLDISTQENHHLKFRIREMQEANEALSVQTMNEVEDFRKQIESLEQDNEHLRNRALEMEQSISQSQSSNSKADIRELRILMGDVTRENEHLKKRLRDMEESTTHLLLSSSDRALMEDLKRDNQSLKLQITEMEEFTRQLQSSSEDSELRRMLEDVTHENEGLKERLHETITTQNHSSNHVEDLQTEIEGLKAEIRRLKVQIESTSSLHRQEDPAIPPPAYDDTEFTPALG